MCSFIGSDLNPWDFITWLKEREEKKDTISYVKGPTKQMTCDLDGGWRDGGVVNELHIFQSSVELLHMG